MKNKDVITAFFADVNATSYTNSLKSQNGYLYSYSLPIAKKINDLYVVYPANAAHNLFYSNTTSKHVSLLLKKFLPQELECNVMMTNTLEDFKAWVSRQQTEQR